MERWYYKEYYNLERTHWWFLSRLKILKILFKKHIAKNTDLNILNAGAATGATSTMLKEYGHVASSEYDKECATFLSEILNEEVSNSSLTDLPYESDSFDVVCAFDVIEHIEDDRKALLEVNRVLNNDGIVFLTVPAFQILWGEHDEVNHHFRRYKISELVSLLKSTGFKVKYQTYFNFLLFIPILIVRILSKNKVSSKEKAQRSDFSKFKTKSLANRILKWIFISEIHVLKFQISVPFGVSALVIAEKSNTA